MKHLPYLLGSFNYRHLGSTIRTIHSKQGVSQRMPSQVFRPPPCDRTNTVYCMTQVYSIPAPVDSYISAILFIPLTSFLWKWTQTLHIDKRRLDICYSLQVKQKGTKQVGCTSNFVTGTDKVDAWLWHMPSLTSWATDIGCRYKKVWPTLWYKRYTLFKGQGSEVMEIVSLTLSPLIFAKNSQSHRAHCTNTSQSFENM